MDTEKERDLITSESQMGSHSLHVQKGSIKTKIVDRCTFVRSRRCCVLAGSRRKRGVYSLRLDYLGLGMPSLDERSDF